MKGSKQTRSMGTLCRGMALDPPCSDALGTAWNKVQKNTPDHTLFFWTLLLDPPPPLQKEVGFQRASALVSWLLASWTFSPLVPRPSPPGLLDLLPLASWTFSPWLLGPSPLGFLASWTFSPWLLGPSPSGFLVVQRGKMSPMIACRTVFWASKGQGGKNVTNDCPILAYHILAYPILSYPIISYHTLSWQILSHPILSYPIISYPILAYPILSCPVLSCPVLSYPILSDPCRIGLLRPIFPLQTVFFQGLPCRTCLLRPIFILQTVFVQGLPLAEPAP